MPANLGQGSDALTGELQKNFAEQVSDAEEDENYRRHENGNGDDHDDH